MPKKVAAKKGGASTDTNQAGESDSTVPAVGAGRELADTVFTHLSTISQKAAELPEGDDFEYHKSFRGFTKSMKELGASMEKTIDVIAAAHFAPKRYTPMASLPLSDQKQRQVMDLVDSFLENTDTLIDEVKGERMRRDKQLQVQFGSSSGQASTAEFGTMSRGGAGKLALRHQERFPIPVDNGLEPFKPLLFDLKSGKLSRGQAGVHPFKGIIEGYAYLDWQLKPSPDFLPPPLAETPLKFVATTADLEALVADLCEVNEMAIDLEHHNFHSYQGYTCLMQLSTRTADYIVDVIAVRGDMYKLNKVFLDASKLKVLHGAVEDIRWLQKDFGLYVANMFDTGIALQTLHLPHSLAFCVDHFAQVKLDKQYQTADWRVRPLPAPMIAYARLDTHYLLYCYDRLKQLLLNADARAGIANLLIHVLNESRKLTLTMYEKPAHDPESSYLNAMGKSLGGLNKAQLEIVKEVYNWRDRRAREDDESPPAVMHTSSILSIACKLPTTPSDVLKVAQPVSASLRKNVREVVDIVSKFEAEAEAGAAVGSPNGGDADVKGGFSASGSPLGGDALSRMSSRFFTKFQPLTGTLPSCDSSTSAAAPRDPEVIASVSMRAAKSSPWLLALSQRGSASNAHASLPKPPSLILPRAKPLHATAPVDDCDRVAGSKAPRTAENEGPEVDDAPPALPEVTRIAGADAGDDNDEDEEKEEISKNTTSLRDQYKGLGRETRRRQRTKN